MWQGLENGKAIMSRLQRWRDSQELCSHPSVRCIQKAMKTSACASPETNGIIMESQKH